MATTKTLADELGVPLSLVKQFLKRRFGRDYKGGDCPLGREEERAVRDAHVSGELKRRQGKTRVATETRHPIDPADVPPVLPQFAPPCFTEGSLGKHRVFLHQDVLEALHDPDVPRRRKANLTRRVQELLTSGRCTRSKGVNGKDKGYRRVPLGGSSGQQFYLWMLEPGARVNGQDTGDLHAACPGFLLRSVRHHDDTGRGTLPIGAASEYAEIDVRDVFGTRVDVTDPLVEGQRRAARCSAKVVRFIEGGPGAGKTTVLNDIAPHVQGRVLYLTWSRALADAARQWLEVAAPEQEHVVLSFAAFLERLDPARPPLPDRPRREWFAEFAERARACGPRLSRWRLDGRLHTAALHTELQAQIFGRALPVEFEGCRASECGLLGRQDYLEHRRRLNGGGEQAHSFASNQSEEERARFFPGPVRAFELAKALRDGELELPEDFAFDAVVVDEVQDLTLIEQWLVLDVAAHAGARRGVAPALFFAGDEAQTVRGTAFEWGPLKNLVRARFGAHGEAAETFRLESSLRSPGVLASYTDRARRVLYRDLDKSSRPFVHVDLDDTAATPGRLARVEVPSDEDAARLCELLARARDAVVVFPHPEVPEWLRDLANQAGVQLLTPEEVKGLEYQTVAVACFPRAVEAVQRSTALAVTHPLAGELARVDIDRLLVALSRSTETLVLVAREWTDDARDRCAFTNRAVTAAGSHADPGPDDDWGDVGDGDLGFISLDDLEALLDDDVDNRERIDVLLQRAAESDDRGDRAVAIELLDQARGLLGRRDRAGSAPAHVRAEVLRKLGSLCALDALIPPDRAVLRRAATWLRRASEPVLGELVVRAGAAFDAATKPVERADAFAAVAAGLSRSEESWDPRVTRQIVEGLAEHLAVLATDAAPPSAKANRSLLGTMAQLAEHPGYGARFAGLAQTFARSIVRTYDARDGRRATRELQRLADVLRPHVPELDALLHEREHRWAGAAYAWLEHDSARALRCARGVHDLALVADIAEQAEPAYAPLARQAAELQQRIQRDLPELHPDDAAALRATLEAALAG